MGLLAKKVKPGMEIGVKKSQVAKGKGSPLGQDGSGSNKKAPKLDSKGVKPGKQPDVDLNVNSGKDSPVGKVRPKQSGGPRAGQAGNKSVVDSDYSGLQQGEGKHGYGKGGPAGRFDQYSAARK